MPESKNEGNTSVRMRELGRIEQVDIKIYGERLIFVAGFNCEESGGRGIQRFAEEKFIHQFMKVVDVVFLTESLNKIVWVTHDDKNIYKIEPLGFGDNDTYLDIENFDIEK